MPTADSTYAFCARFFADLRALGVHEAVVCPGSRSTPLALSAHAAGLDVTVHLDERVGGFHALGQARATGRPSVVICTSGTAGANLLPAVVEAHHSGVPMIVCTADRPPELRTWGAGQTIDQIHLYGTNVRWFHEVPVAGEVSPRHASSLALRSVTTSVDRSGPVHLNWPLREPLAPAGPVEVPASRFKPHANPEPGAASSLLAALGRDHEQGLIVVGPADLAESTAAEIATFASCHGWPVIADPASGLRNDAHDAPVITTGELLFASAAFTRGLPRCEVVVRVGSSPTSKAYRQWLEADRPDHLVLVAPGVEWADPTDSVTSIVAAPVAGRFATAPAASRRSGWVDYWTDAERAAAKAVAEVLDAETDGGVLSELGSTHSLLKALATAGPLNLVVSNSMPVRDVDVAMRAAGRIRVIANRGANGIDGVIATATGVARSSDLPTVVLIGDVATVHDLGGLAAASRLGVANLAVVVIDNDAGGIFSFLPVAQAVDGEVFRELFTTPHGTDIAAVARALGLEVVAAEQVPDAPRTAGATGRPRLAVVPTRAADTVARMAEVRAAVDRAVAASNG